MINQINKLEGEPNYYIISNLSLNNNTILPLKLSEFYQNLGNTLNPEFVRVNNLPLKSGELTDLNSFSSVKYTESINGGCIFMNTIPEDSFGGNFTLFKKCLSSVNITLSSDLAKSNICLSFKPNSTLLISNFSLQNIRRCSYERYLYLIK